VQAVKIANRQSARLGHVRVLEATENLHRLLYF